MWYNSSIRETIISIRAEGITNVRYHFDKTPPPQNNIKGRYDTYTMRSTPGKESRAFYNGVVLLRDFVLQP